MNKVEQSIREYLSLQHPREENFWMNLDGNAVLTEPRIGLVARDLLYLYFFIKKEYGIQLLENDVVNYGLISINQIVQRIQS